MNPFERHGLDHLSASSCNLFAAQPALWVAERLLGRKGPVGAAAHRGAAVEAGVTLGLLDPGMDVEVCAEAGSATFRSLTALSGDLRRDTEGAAVPEIVKTVLPELRAYGHDVVCQERIEWRAEGVAVPYIGYIDYRWPYHQILVDLKTQLRLVTEIKRPHARQVAAYAGAYGNGVDARLVYATPKKFAVYQLENVREHIDCLSQIGRTMQRFLAVSDDAEELAHLLIPDVDSFYFSDPITRQMAWDTWGV